MLKYFLILLICTLQPLLKADWQQAFLLYNKGTVALEESRFDEALLFFVEAATDPDPFPPMEKNLLQNRALARYLHSFSSSPEVAKYHLQRGVEDVERARTVQCEIAKLMGYKVCNPSNNLERLQTLLMEALNHLTSQKVPLDEVEGPSASLNRALITLTQGFSSQAQKEGGNFLKTVDEYQRENPGCHQSPWNRVLPLFTSGYAFLEEGKNDLAVLRWEKALKILNQSPKEIEPIPTDSETEQVLINIQKMLPLDATRPINISPKKGPSPLNPW